MHTLLLMLLVPGLYGLEKQEYDGNRRVSTATRFARSNSQLDANQKRSVTLTENTDAFINCPDGNWSLKISDAAYGLPHKCAAYNSRDILSSRCDRKSSCYISASNAVFGDPCPGDHKQLSVDYHCVQDTANYVLACEGDNLNLYCPEGSTINILKSNYGRTNPYICFNSPIPSHVLGCSSSKARSILHEGCKGKSYCSLRAINNIFGDPCPGTLKYLEVEYSCQTNQKKGVTLTEGKNTYISCPQRDWTLRILDATFGRPNECVAYNSRDILSSRCDHLSSCNLFASLDVFGDPCIGKRKQLHVDYQCVPDTSKYSLACQDADLNLECPEGYTIHILKSNYGRTNPYTCLNSPKPSFVVGCSSLKAGAIISEGCEGNSYCALRAMNDIFGDPCPGLNKYLEVEYSCQNN